jgi:nicotinate-nucleotide adenylyltransferase
MPPHKSHEDLIPFAHRYAMVSLAVAGMPAFIPSIVEQEPKASPYSIDTMRKLTRRMGLDGGAFYFIAGWDSLYEIKSWRQGEKLLNSYNFIFVMRPGIDPIDIGSILPQKILRRVRDLTGLKRVQVQRRIANRLEDGNRIYLVDIKAPDISATRIRHAASLHKRIQHLIPKPVGEYIRKLHLYGER